MAKCLYCGAEITEAQRTRPKKRKYCSRECEIKDKYYKQWAYTICQYCGKTFKESRDRPNLYCSIACSVKGQARIELFFKQEIDMSLGKTPIEKANEIIEHKQNLFSQYQELIKKAEEIRYRLEHERCCEECGEIFLATHSNQIYCSEKCRERHRSHNKSNRIYRNGKPDLSITLKRLWDRDKGICQICGRHIDFNCDPNSDYYPSIDHIVPIAKGGAHTWVNVQLACRICNSVKRDTIPPLLEK